MPFDNPKDSQSKIPEEKVVVKVALKPDGNISMSIGANIPLQLLSYVHRLIGVEIDKKIIDHKLRQRDNSDSKIVLPKKHGIIDFMRGRAQ